MPEQSLSDARLAELRSQEEKEEQKRRDAEERERRAAKEREAEAARIAAMGPEERRIAELRERFEKARELGDRKAGGPLAQRFNGIIEEAGSWPPERREELVPLLEEINKFLEGNLKKRRVKIRSLQK